jgi:tRNA1Val (adenine37-N6)-methyltransferase
MAVPPFTFKQFSVVQEGAAHPTGTDSVMLGAWAHVSGATRILDVGTGTGILSLMAAQRSPAARITAIDIHPASVLCARKNFQASPWSDRLEAVEISVQSLAARQSGAYDLIISNPPYFSDLVVSPDPNRRLGRHTASLTPGALIDSMLRLLAPEGCCCLILPVAEGKRLYEMATLNGLYHTRITEVRTRPTKRVERLLIRLERNPYNLVRDSLVVYEEQEIYTDGFRQLTEAFYL